MEERREWRGGIARGEEERKGVWKRAKGENERETKRKMKREESVKNMTENKRK